MNNKILGILSKTLLIILIIISLIGFIIFFIPIFEDFSSLERVANNEGNLSVLLLFITLISFPIIIFSSIQVLRKKYYFFNILSFGILLLFISISATISLEEINYYILNKNKGIVSKCLESNKNNIKIYNGINCEHHIIKSQKDIKSSLIILFVGFFLIFLLKKGINLNKK